MPSFIPSRLPDFRNLGVVLRCLVLVEVLSFGTIFSHASDMREAIEVFISSSMLREPILLVAIALFALMSPVFSLLVYRNAVILALVLAFAVGGLYQHFISTIAPDFESGAFKAAFVSFLVASIVLIYFDMRQRALSPAFANARLMALQARIRPHFLFNSLNAVMGLIRDDPRRAEMVLENLSDLYRALMAESGSLVPLSKELDLARAYAEIEVIRLGERLRIEWRCDETAMDARVPPLILQPLVENAVYHGIEPAPEGGQVQVSATRKGDEVTLMVRNTCASAENGRSGNRMALDNIRERMDLHFDAEARMSAYRTDDEYVVQITLPYKHV